MSILSKAKNLMFNLLHTRSFNMSRAETLDALHKGIELGYNTAYSEGYAQGKKEITDAYQNPARLEAQARHYKEMTDEAYAVGYAKGKTDGINETKAPINKPKPTLKEKLDEAKKLWTEDKPAKKRGRPFKQKEPQPQGMPTPTPKKRGRPAKPKGE